MTEETKGFAVSRYMPSNSTTIGTLGGGALAPVAVWLLGATLKTDVPAEVGASLGAVLGNLLGYFFEGGRKT